MSVAIRAEFEEIRRLQFNAIQNLVFTGVGTACEHPVRMIILHNFTDSLLVFSRDGLTDEFELGVGGDMVLDMTANKTIESGFSFEQGTRLYTRWYTGAPTTGHVSFSVIYGDTGIRG